MGLQATSILTTAMLVVATIGSAAAPGCSPDLADGDCYWPTCSETGVVEGNASVSGLFEVDSFFAAVIRAVTRSKQVEHDLRVELDGIAALLDLEPGASGSDLRRALQKKLEAYVTGRLVMTHSLAPCAMNAGLLIESMSRCDARVDPAADARCRGRCEAEVDLRGEALCRDESEVTCVGVAPGFDCEGSCEGTCELPEGGSCEGTCRGSCDGICRGSLDESGRCEGECEGTCTGTCELGANSVCEGQCKGMCTSAPVLRSRCTPGATAYCENTIEGGLSAAVDCRRACLGELLLPEFDPHCAAAAKSEVLLATSCPPPALAVSYEPNSSLSQNPAARLEFEVWLKRFEMRYRALQAALAKARLVHDASAALVHGARASIDPFAEAAAEATAEGDLTEGIGLGCALDEFPRAVRFLEETASSLAPAYQEANDLTLFVH